MQGFEKFSANRIKVRMTRHNSTSLWKTGLEQRTVIPSPRARRVRGPGGGGREQAGWRTPHCGLLSH